MIGVTTFVAIGENLNRAVTSIGGSAGQLQTGVKRFARGQKKMTRQVSAAASSVAIIATAATDIQKATTDFTTKLTSASTSVDAAATTMNTSAEKLENAATRLDSAAVQVVGATTALNAVATSQQAVIDDIAATGKQTGEVLKRVQTALDGFVRGSEQFEKKTATLGTAFENTATQLDGFQNTVGTFTSAVNDQLLPSLDAMHAACGALPAFAEAITQVDRAAEMLDELNTRHFRDAAVIGHGAVELQSRLTALGGILTEVMRLAEAISKSQSQLTTAATGFDATATKAATSLDSAAGTLGDAASRVSAAAGTLGAVPTTFAQLPALADAVKTLCTLVDTLAASTNGAISGLTAAARLTKPLERLEQTINAIAAHEPEEREDEPRSSEPTNGKAHRSAKRGWWPFGK
jgi:DNA repair ATPase RecN